MINYVVVNCANPECNITFQKQRRTYNENIKHGWKIFCSKKCQYEDMRTSKEVICTNPKCEKRVVIQKARLEKSETKNFYCSNSCANSHSNTLYKRLENHPNWINGKSNYRSIAKRTYEEKCVICGYSEDKRMLEVDHIDSNRRNNKPENLQFLCVWCHYCKTRGVPYHRF